MLKKTKHEKDTTSLSISSANMLVVRVIVCDSIM